MERPASDERLGSLNDLSWYSRNPNLLAAAGSFPYPYRPGMTLPLSSPTGKEVLPKVASVMSISWIPSFGNSSLPTDPASIAAQEMYTKVRSVYIGSLDADAPDFMVYIGALDSVFTYIGWLKRLYRAISTYSPENMALPKVIFGRFNAIDSKYFAQFAAHKVRFWQGINELILKSRKFKCPAVMDLFNRHYWMSDNLYADANSPKAQLYMFDLHGVYKIATLTEVSASQPVTGLQMVRIPQTATSGSNIVETLLSFGDALIQALDSWDDCYQIAGYLMKAYDGVPSFTVAELEQGELLNASYVPEVLAQIENVRAVCPMGLGLSDAACAQITVTQNVATNSVVSNVNFDLDLSSTSYADELSGFKALLAVEPTGNVNPAINSRSDMPTVADSVIATRLHAYAQYSLNAQNKIHVVVTAGTEIPLSIGIADESDTYFQRLPQIAPVNLAEKAGSDPVTVQQLSSLFNIAQFDWHPICYAFVGRGTDRTSAGLTVVGDVHNMAVISVQDLANLHRICTFSEFNSFAV